MRSTTTKSSALCAFSFTPSTIVTMPPMDEPQRIAIETEAGWLRIRDNVERGMTASMEMRLASLPGGKDGEASRRVRKEVEARMDKVGRSVCGSRARADAQIRASMWDIASHNLRVNGHDYDKFVQGEAARLPMGRADQQRPSRSTRSWIGICGPSTPNESSGRSSSRINGNNARRSCWSWNAISSDGENMPNGYRKATTRMVGHVFVSIQSRADRFRHDGEEGCGDPSTPASRRDVKDI